MAKEVMQQIIDERFQKLTEEYNTVKTITRVPKILIYKESNGILEELKKDDIRWKKFCNSLFEENSVANITFKNLNDRIEWAEEISFIWRENKFAQEEIDKMRISVIIKPFEDNQVLIIDNKRWKKVKVYLL